MLDLKNWVWDSDIEVAITRINPRTRADPGYWFATVGRIEAGKHPTRNEPLTMDALIEWKRRCQEGDEAHADHTTKEDDQDRLLSNKPQTIHPRNRGPLHQHHQ